MGLKECIISLDNQWATYYPGQTINGRVDYVFDAPKKLRGITVMIKGEARVSWSTTESRKNEQGASAEQTVMHTADEEYFSISYYLTGGKGSEMELPAGTHSYPFACALPPTLPSSFEGEHGHVRYTVKVTLDRPWKFDQETKMAFTVVAHVDLNAMPQAQAPARMHLEKHFCCCWCKSGPLAVDVGLPVSGFCSGQTMPFDISVENGSNVDVDSVTLIFRKLVVFRCSAPSYSTNTSNVEIARIVTDPIPAHSTVNWTKILEIPSLPPSNLVNCGIIDLDYEIQIDVSNSGCHMDMDTACPVYIGTVPLAGYVAPPPEGHSISVLPDVPPASAPPASDRVDSQNIYPALARQPVYLQSQFGTSDIHDSSDNQHTMISGNAYFAPMYPTYGFHLPGPN